MGNCEEALCSAPGAGLPRKRCEPARIVASTMDIACALMSPRASRQRMTVCCQEVLLGDWVGFVVSEELPTEPLKDVPVPNEAQLRDLLASSNSVRGKLSTIMANCSEPFKKRHRASRSTVLCERVALREGFGQASCSALRKPLAANR